MKKVIYLITGFLIFNISPAHASLLFFDDFTNGASTEWGNEVGEWTTCNGAYNATINTPHNYSSLLAFSNLTDFILNIDIYNFNDGGVWIHTIDNKNGILLGSGIDGNDLYLYWLVVENGIINPSQNIGRISNIQNTDGHLTIYAVGNTYSAYWNNDLVVAITTDKFPSGKIALYDYLDETVFDNFSLSDFNTTVPEPATLFLFATGILGLGAHKFRRS